MKHPSTVLIYNPTIEHIAYPNTLIVESAFPDTNIYPCSYIPLVKLWCPTKVWIYSPVRTFQTRIVASNEPDITRSVSGLNYKDYIYCILANNSTSDGTEQLSDRTSFRIGPDQLVRV